MGRCQTESLRITNEASHVTWNGLSACGVGTGGKLRPLSHVIQAGDGPWWARLFDDVETWTQFIHTNHVMGGRKSRMRTEQTLSVLFPLLGVSADMFLFIRSVSRYMSGHILFMQTLVSRIVSPDSVIGFFVLFCFVLGWIVCLHGHQRQQMQNQ